MPAGLATPTMRALIIGIAVHIDGLELVPGSACDLAGAVGARVVMIHQNVRECLTDRVEKFSMHLSLALPGASQLLRDPVIDPETLQRQA